jgi:SAM-dependent methyltransferase
VKFTDWFDADYCHGHDSRFAESVAWMEPHLRPGAEVVDFGRGLEENPFDTAIRKGFPDVRWRTTGDADLRYPLPHATASVDGVCLMEVIEHLRDRDESPADFWEYSGIKNCLSEAFRILKPGGWAFLSTPNGSRYTCAWNVVRGESPAWVRAHVRELGFCEFTTLLAEAGFVVERIQTLDVFDHQDYPAELAAVMDAICPYVPRGHSIFCLARKPESAR